MKAERQHKEPQKAESIQSKRERSKLSFVDNRSQTVSQTRLIKSIQKKENKVDFPDNQKAYIENLSGNRIDDVQIHCKSDSPVQLTILEGRRKISKKSEVEDKLKSIYKSKNRKDAPPEIMTRISTLVDYYLPDGRGVITIENLYEKIQNEVVSLSTFFSIQEGRTGGKVYAPNPDNEITTTKVNDSFIGKWIRLEKIRVIAATLIKSHNTLVDVSKRAQKGEGRKPEPTGTQADKDAIISKRVAEHLTSSTNSDFLSGKLVDSKVFNFLCRTKFFSDLKEAFDSSSRVNLGELSVALVRLPPALTKAMADTQEGGDVVDLLGEISKSDLNALWYKWNGKIYSIPQQEINSFFGELFDLWKTKFDIQSINTVYASKAKAPTILP